MIDRNITLSVQHRCKKSDGADAKHYERRVGDVFGVKENLGLTPLI
jgi:hypothetical protein